MADPRKAELGAELARVLGTGTVTLAPGASTEERKRAQRELEWRTGIRSTRPEPEPERVSDDAEHERRMVAFSVQKLRERADAAEAEASEAWTARDTKREHELRAKAERLRRQADLFENTQRAQDRAKGKL